MCTIRERTNSFAVLCNWIKELSNSIQELSNMANMPSIWKNVGIRELFYSITGISNYITELFNWIRELSYSFKDKLNKRAL